jgi:hypothetical protein
VDRERYRCPKCGAIVLAEDVDQVRWVYPHGVEPNSSRYGMVPVVVRPGALFCHGAHQKPIPMRREGSG